MLWVYIGGGVLIIVAIIYNAFVVRSNRVNNAFASIDVFLKQRADLIPSLIETVKGYMGHEEKVLKTLAEIRSQSTTNQGRSDSRVLSENQLTADVQRIFVQVENYPELKASTNFLQLQRSMNEVEAQLSASRRAFNASVTEYNNLVQSFPSNLMARIFGFKDRYFFAIPEDNRAAFEVRPNANFSAS